MSSSCLQLAPLLPAKAYCREKGLFFGCFLAYSVAFISGLSCSGEDKRGQRKIFVWKVVSQESCLCVVGV